MLSDQTKPLVFPAFCMVPCVMKIKILSREGHFRYLIEEKSFRILRLQKLTDKTVKGLAGVKGGKAGFLQDGIEPFLAYEVGSRDHGSCLGSEIEKEGEQGGSV